MTITEGQTEPTQSELTVSRINDHYELKFIMDKEMFGIIKKLSDDRGVSVTEMFAEAIRMERVFANSRMNGIDARLYLRTQGDLREIVNV